jgi:hypothetical protein
MPHSTHTKVVTFSAPGEQRGQEMETEYTSVYTAMCEEEYPCVYDPAPLDSRSRLTFQIYPRAPRVDGSDQWTYSSKAARVISMAEAEETTYHCVTPKVVDTGCTTTVISRSLATTLGCVFHERAPYSAGLGDGKTQARGTTYTVVVIAIPGIDGTGKLVVQEICFMALVLPEVANGLLLGDTTMLRIDAVLYVKNQVMTLFGGSFKAYATRWSAVAEEWLQGSSGRGSKQHFRTERWVEPIIRSIPELYTCMMVGPEAPTLHVSDAVVAAISVEYQRLETIGRDAYLNAGRRDANIVGQMVVVGSILDACDIQQQVETFHIIHSGLPGAADPSVERPVVCVIQAMEEARTRCQAYGGKRALPDVTEYEFLQRGLQAAISQEAEAIVQINRMELTDVHDVYLSGSSDGTTIHEASLRARTAALASLSKDGTLASIPEEGTDAALPHAAESSPPRATDTAGPAEPDATLVKAQEDIAEHAATVEYLRTMRQQHLCLPLPDARPDLFPEHL